MLVRSLGVLGSVLSLYLLWILFLPASVSRTGLVSLGVMGLIGLVGAGLAQRVRPGRTIFQVVRGVEAERVAVATGRGRN